MVHYYHIPEKFDGGLNKFDELTVDNADIKLNPGNINID